MPVHAGFTIRGVSAFCALLASFSLTVAAPRPKGVPRGAIEPETVEEYKKRGAVPGIFQESESVPGSVGYMFVPNNDLSKGIPGFRLNMRDENNRSFPEVTVGFGLDCQVLDCDEGTLERLGELKTLRILNLGQCQGVTDEGLAHLSECKELFRLNLASTSITDKSMATLVKMKNMHGLTLSGTGITDAGLEELTQLRELRYLNLSHCTNLTEKGLRELGKFKRLTSLNLTSVQGLTGEMMASLGELKDLESLYLGSTPIDEKGLIELAKLPKLRSLNLDGCNTLNGKALKQIGQMPKLEWLSMNSNPQLQDKDFEELGPCPALKTLHVLGARGLTGEGLKPLAGHKTLTDLQLSQTGLTEEGAKAIGEISSLETLNISYCQTKGLLKSFDKLKNLKQLQAVGTLTDDSELKQLHKLPNLTSVSLFQSRVTPKGMAELKKVNPKVNILHNPAQWMPEVDGDAAEIPPE